jgi:hypothetical protein
MSPAAELGGGFVVEGLRAALRWVWAALLMFWGNGVMLEWVGPGSLLGAAWGVVSLLLCGVAAVKSARVWRRP